MSMPAPTLVDDVVRDDDEWTPSPHPILDGIGFAAVMAALVLGQCLVGALLR